MKSLIKKIRSHFNIQSEINSIKIEKNGILNGQILTELNKEKEIKELSEVEFSVFSQNGEDGIIQYILSKIKIPNKKFIEFGVENYIESNTRFLMMKDDWKGLVIDGSSKNIEKIKKSYFYWKHDVLAIEKFITKENINKIFLENGFEGEIGLLSIDIDGNDYWVWESIDVVDPIVVIVEYNAIFGKEDSITIPYNANFVRTKAHHSGLYFGASLQALIKLGERKGYKCIGTDKNAVNVFFIRNDFTENFTTYKEAKEIWKEHNSRQSRDKNGILTFLSGEKRIEEIKGLEIFDIKLKAHKKL